MNTITALQMKALPPESYFFMDVRTYNEVKTHPYTDILVHHIPMDEVPDRLQEIPKDIEIIVGCKAGSRSAKVCDFLNTNGYHKTTNLVGGILAWSELS